MRLGYPHFTSLESFVDKDGTKGLNNVKKNSNDCLLGAHILLVQTSPEKGLYFHTSKSIISPVEIYGIIQHNNGVVIIVPFDKVF